MPPRAKKRTATTESLNMEEYRIGNGYDVHALKEGLPMWLCGVRIESETGFVAHSDGDVAIHALCDALLGAAALGDIGLHFPDNDDRWKGVDSKLLLKEVMSMVRAKGYETAPAHRRDAFQARGSDWNRHRQHLGKGHDHRTSRLRRQKGRLRGLGHSSHIQNLNNPIMMTDFNE